MVASTPLELYGRKTCLMWNNLFYIAAAGLTISGSVYGLYFGRFISGLCMGITNTGVPMLLAEIATDSQRGRLAGQFPVFGRMGMFVSSLIGYGFVLYVEDGWKYVQMFPVIPCSIMLSK